MARDGEAGAGGGAGRQRGAQERRVESRESVEGKKGEIEDTTLFSLLVYHLI